MPTDRDVAFVALDEAQLGADPERGHVFTDRLLRARGREETMILGSGGTRADGARAGTGGGDHPPSALFDAQLCGARRNCRACPSASVIVAFCAEEVYAVAEMLRRTARRRGGGHGRAVPAHPQRAGRDVSGGRGRLSRRHRRHRHGPEHGRRAMSPSPA